MLNHIKSNRKYVRYSLVTSLKEVKARLYGEDGYAVKESIFKGIKGKVLKSQDQKGGIQILDEYCRNTGQTRKYVIRKIQPRVDLRPKPRKKRKEIYDGEVKAALAKVWGIFDYPCGQRLKPVLQTEIERLRSLGELNILGDVAVKLRGISSATIDRKLKHFARGCHLVLRNSHLSRISSAPRIMLSMNSFTVEIRSIPPTAIDHMPLSSSTGISQA